MKISGLSIVPSALFLLLALAISASGQKPAPTATPEDNDVVKITTKLVQVDLLVVDKDGKQVTGLTKSDFELFQDGKPQRITDLSYVNTDPGAAPARVETTITAKTPTGIPPPARLRAGEFGRVITFIVDDGNCAASMVGMGAARSGVERFIREQMRPDDVVAIYQTRSGSSVFQQYTNDKVQLLKVTSKIRWYPATGTCGSGDGSFFEAAKANTYNKSTPGGETLTIESPEEKARREATEDFTRNNQVVGSLGVIRYVVEGLQRVPGRKVVFFISDGLPYRARDGQTLSSVDVLRDLTDLANRSSVVLNTIDDRGVFDASMMEARDEVLPKTDVMATSKIANDRERSVRDSQDGLAFMANETGGTFTRNQNNLDGPIRRLLELEKGFYLIAYEPSDETFKGKKFNRITVKVNRPGARVITRSGFTGIPDQAVKVKKRTGDSELYEAIVAPLPRAGLDVRLSAFFGNSPAGNYVRSLFHLNGNEITFTDADGGLKKVVLDVVAVTLNEKNAVVDEFTRAHTLKFDAATVELIKRNGLIYSADVPIKNPGTYNFRVAVRDASSKMIGTAGQMVQIPDLKRPGLYVAGLAITGVDANGKFAVPAASTAETAVSLPPTTAVPAIRRFRRGSIVAYAYNIYNAQLDRATGRPNIEIKMNLFRDGKLILEGPVQKADLQNQSDWARIADFAYMRLNQQTEPGDYALQIIIRDLLAPVKTSTSSQWIDFEVIN